MGNAPEVSLREKRARRTDVPPAALLLRDGEAAIVLGVSVSQIAVWTRQGVFHHVRLPGIRAVRYSRAEVEELARRWCADAGVPNQNQGDVATKTEAA